MTMAIKNHVAGRWLGLRTGARAILARAYSALASHRRLTRYNKDVRVSAALTVCRVQSILLGVIVASATILFY